MLRRLPLGMHRVNLGIRLDCQFHQLTGVKSSLGARVQRKANCRDHSDERYADDLPSATHLMNHYPPTACSKLETKPYTPTPIRYMRRDGYTFQAIFRFAIEF